MAHKGSKERVAVLPGEAYVAKSRTTAFLEPQINFTLLDESLTKKWQRDLETMNVWVQRARDAKASHREVMEEAIEDGMDTGGSVHKISEHDMERRAEEAKRAMSFCTPRAKREKLSKPEAATLEGINLPAFGPLGSPDGTEPMDPEVRRRIDALDDQILALRDLLGEINERQQADANYAALIGTFAEKLAALAEEQIGSKPTDLDEDFEVVDLWGGYGLMANKWGKSLDEIDGRLREAIKKGDEETGSKAKSALESLTRSLTQDVKKHEEGVIDVIGRLDFVQDYASRGLTKLKD